MPATKKSLRNAQLRQNVKNGVGDENGRKIETKAAKKTAICTVCAQELKISATNIPLGAHQESKHPKKTYAECWPGQTPPVKK